MAQRDPVLEVRLFGGVEVLLSGCALTPVRSKKEWELLALLLRAPGKPHDRSQLAQWLWPDARADQHSSYLRRELYNLRKCLGVCAGRLQTDGGHTLAFEATGVQVDSLEFDAAVARGDVADLHAAVALYRGEFMCGFDASWIRYEREQRRNAYLSALERLSAAAMETGDHTGAAHFLSLALAIDPVREAAVRSLMRAHRRAGNRSAALAAYNQLRRSLADGLLGEPQPETTELYNAIRAESRRAKAQRSSDNRRVVGNLPRPLTEIIGRSAECDEAASLMRTRRLLTLTGPGGIGKTRLSLEVARHLAGDYLDGVWFVKLAPLPRSSDPHAVARAVANVIGVREQPGTDLLETVCAYLSQKTCLLILDNCEHVQDGAALVARRILESSAEVRILATSRHVLRLAGRHQYLVRPLAAPDPARLPQDEVGAVQVAQSYPAVSLFVERARGCSPDFALSSGNAATIARICRRLDGVPLALELAAARVGGLPLQAIAADLDERFSLLDAGDPTGDTRHLSLESAIEWSFALLSERECKIAETLSVFQGGWTLEAAVALCGHGTEAVLADLVDKSLVTLDEAALGGPRYGMLESIRDFCRRRLARSGRLEDAQRRHLAWFADFAERAEPNIRGPEQMEWLAKLDAERDNVRAAFDASARSNEASVDKLRLAVALWHYCEIRGDYREGRARLGHTLRGCPHAAPLLRSKALAAEGILADDLCDASEPRERMREAVCLAQESGDRRLLAFALKAEGWLRRSVDPPAAATQLHAATELARQTGDTWLLADCLSTEGFHALMQDKPENAQAAFTEGLSYARQSADRWLIDELVYHLGLVACATEQYDAAIEYLSECLAIERELGSRTRLASAAYYLGSVLGFCDDTHRARTLLEESRTLALEVGARRTAAAAVTALGILAINAQEYEVGARLFGAAAAIGHGIDSRLLSIWNGRTARALENALANLGREQFDAAWSAGRIHFLSHGSV